MDAGHTTLPIGQQMSPPDTSALPLPRNPRRASVLAEFPRPDLTRWDDLPANEREPFWGVGSRIAQRRQFDGRQRNLEVMLRKPKEPCGRRRIETGWRKVCPCAGR
jgi:hypothetical protein